MSTHKGKVYIVGGGPGDPDLLTVKARKIINSSQVVLHDSLVTNKILESIPESTDIIDIGKKSGKIRPTQKEINKMMVKKAKRGKKVVRLKGGDPTIFGRGGEESEFLAKNNIEFEIIPGISSILTPSILGIPLTHREYSSSITVITGHEDPSKEESSLDWKALAENIKSGGTLIILMGVSKLKENIQELIDNGLSRDTPISIIEKATWEREKLSTGNLKEIQESNLEIDSPAVIIIGNVVNLQKKIGKLTNRPTENKRSETEKIKNQIEI